MTAPILCSACGEALVFDGTTHHCQGGAYDATIGLAASLADAYAAVVAERDDLRARLMADSAMDGYFDGDDAGPTDAERDAGVVAERVSLCDIEDALREFGEERHREGGYDMPRGDHSAGGTYNLALNVIERALCSVEDERDAALARASGAEAAGRALAQACEKWLGQQPAHRDPLIIAGAMARYLATAPATTAGGDA